MPIAKAQRLAPNAIFVPTRHGVYSPYAKQVRSILERFTPIVQTASIDEFFLDFRGCATLYHQPEDKGADATIERVVRYMRDAVQREVGLPSSAGIGTTRTVAKMSSVRAKPAGVLMIRAGEELDFVWALPVRRLPGIGPVAEAKLTEAGITTLGELLDLPPGPLRARFGPFSARVRARLTGVQSASLGRDRPAFREHDPEGLTVGSISNERTFSRDKSQRVEVEAQLHSLSQRVCWRARKRGATARTVTLKLRYADFKTITRSKTAHPTHDEGRVFARILRLLDAAWTREKPIRLVGVALSNLQEDLQLTLPFPIAERPQVGSAIDVIRAKFGYDAIRLGGAAKRTRWLA
jgi:DNA polymerase-4